MSDIVLKTGLWARSLALDDPNAKRLAAALLKARSNIQDLLAGIPGDMKGYTVHDITHLDALWEMADLIAGPDFPLNPPEAFVFGLSVLLHDSAMTVMAYPGGLEELSKTEVWHEQASNFGLTGEDLASIPAGTRAALVTTVLRALHAQQAERLATQTWSLGSKHFHIIEDDDLRNHYGPIAGKIAHSHHWDARSLLTKFSSTLGAFGDMPASWTVDCVKIATLLRCADASHIDHRRAPRRLFAMSRPTGISETHWGFQSKLAKPYVSGDRLCYSSTEPFDISSVDAWYLCFDTAQVVARELADADENLRARGCQFIVSGVQGAKSVGLFAECVQTNGWKPVGVDVQVSDVPALARTLGGEALYSSKLAPMRELLQNAADSIDARAQVDPDFSKEKGAIVVRVVEQDGAWRIDVEDNGIGMSERVLTRALLDFGKSFWRSELVQDEYPQMRGGFRESRGKFGIGFFSVFMWAEKVTVVSRKFADALSDTMAIEFLGGISQRPILRNAYPRERSSNTVTRVSLAVSKDTAQLVLGKLGQETESRRRHMRRFGLNWHRDMRASSEVFEGGNPVQKFCAALDIDVLLEAEGKSELVNNRRWMGLPGKDFVEYFSKVCGTLDSEAASAVSEIIEGGVVKGRALLVPSYLQQDDVALLVHDKGITVSILYGAGVFGVAEGSVLNAARDRADVPKVTENTAWMDEQQARVFLSASDAARQIAAQKMLVGFKRFASDRILFVLNREMLSLDGVLDRISESGKVRVRISEESNGEYEWKEVTKIDVIVGVRIDPDRLFALCDLRIYEFDEKQLRLMLSGAAQDSVAGKIFAEIGRVIGHDCHIDFHWTEQDSYSRRRDAVVAIQRAKS